MEIEKKNNILDAKTLNELINVQNKVLSEVICYLWLNTINPKEPIDIIDAVEFVFSDGSKLALTGNESQEGLEFIQYNFEAEKSFIEKEFGDKIKIFKVKANTTEMWKGVINTKLVKVCLTKDKETQNYLSDEIVLEFENNEMRLIQVHPLDGVIIDYFDDVR